ncbi:MAG: carboxypeptidase-like regulatory domain-containing protein [Roseiflexaceae bacterium]
MPNYSIYTSETVFFSAELDSVMPIYQLIARLVDQHELPRADDTATSGYALFGGTTRRRLSSEQTLAQAGFAAGADLYLAYTYDPWWLEMVTPAAATDQPVIAGFAAYLLAVPAARVIMSSGLLAMVLVAIFLPRMLRQPAPATTTTPTPAITGTVGPSKVPIAQRATDPPRPTPSPTQLPTAAPTQTPTATQPPPSPTPTIAPAPAEFVGVIADRKVDARSDQCNAFASSIYGSVETSGGRGIGGARVQVVSGDGRSRFAATTQRNGTYSIPGLGCTTWVVRLIAVPNASNGFEANSVTVRGINGSQFTSFRVRFRQR